jgi:glyoxylase-like metal-dependent hydrolase (beta-lactamase superfamily II)
MPEPEIHTLHVGINNLYLVKTDEGGILVDAGPDFTGSWNALIANVVGAGLAPEDIRYVLVTHFHSDHAGFARRWQDLGAKIFAGAGDAWHLRKGPESYPDEADVLWTWMKRQGAPDDLTAGLAERILRIYAFSKGEETSAQPSPETDAMPEVGEWYPEPLRMAPVVVDPLFDRDTVELGGVRVEAIATPGHTPGSTCFWEPESGTLFTGDHIIPGIFSNPSLYFEENDLRRRVRSTPNYIRSVEKLRLIPAKRVASGHKREAHDLPAMIDRILHHHGRRLERFATSVTETPRTLFELAEANYPRLVRRDLWYVMAEVTGLVDVLEDQGRVVVDREGEVERIRRT